MILGGSYSYIECKGARATIRRSNKTKLGNSEVAGAVDSIVSEHLSYYLQEHPKETREILIK